MTAIEATIYVLTTIEGGRNTPFRSFYKPYFESPHYQGDCAIASEPSDGGTEFCLGFDYSVEIWLPRIPLAGFAAGEHFTLKEGPKCIANGVVTNLKINPA